MAQNEQGRRAFDQSPRLAFSLVELLAVLVIVGLLATAGVMRFGSHTVENLGAEGFARRLALSTGPAGRHCYNAAPRLPPRLPRLSHA